MSSGGLGAIRSAAALVIAGTPYAIIVLSWQARWLRTHAGCLEDSNSLNLCCIGPYFDIKYSITHT
jgi:hypothetical protein